MRCQHEWCNNIVTKTGAVYCSEPACVDAVVEANVAMASAGFPTFCAQCGQELPALIVDVCVGCAGSFDKHSTKRKRSIGKMLRLHSSIMASISRRIRHPKDNVISYIGCSIKELANHLESQFKPGMTWDNYGRCGWHIDHIVPVAQLAREEFPPEVIHHYTNLQPMWAADNAAKRDMMPWEWDEYVEKHGLPSERLPPDHNRQIVPPQGGSRHPRYAPQNVISGG
jgi:hypothetical protein